MNDHALSVCFSSHDENWETPPDMIRDLKSVFEWDLDVCASRPNVCKNYYTPKDNALMRIWGGLCWMNPPYGRNIGQWVDRASLFGQGGNTVVSLLPARTDTAWFQKYVQYSSCLVFIRGRLKFGSEQYWKWVWEQEYLLPRGKMIKNSLFQKHGKKNAAPFPSCFMVFGVLTKVQRFKLSSYGIAR